MSNYRIDVCDRCGRDGAAYTLPGFSVCPVCDAEPADLVQQILDLDWGDMTDWVDIKTECLHLDQYDSYATNGTVCTWCQGCGKLLRGTP